MKIQYACPERLWLFEERKKHFFNLNGKVKCLKWDSNFHKEIQGGYYNFDKKIFCGGTLKVFCLNYEICLLSAILRVSSNL